ncbi:hypothetical protein Bca52824_018484 [Brassica carinata]|uniref:Uncharacterized protein n=1 Tax=Brassica carinata TaxID=52824 RepID=A0A8X7VQK6_BRACI|nr:hypothetical protein Bca52824_018484 [Brassica carinata]
MATKAMFVFFISALCLSSLAGKAMADADDFDSFKIQGSVYCDTCRVQFVTRLSKFLEGAKVKLECRSRTNGTVALTKEAVTDKSGSYTMEVTGDHEEEVCELVLLQSPDSTCSDVSQDAYLRNAAKVSLTANDVTVYLVDNSEVSDCGDPNIGGGNLGDCEDMSREHADENMKPIGVLDARSSNVKPTGKME